MNTKTSFEKHEYRAGDRVTITDLRVGSTYPGTIERVQSGRAIVLADDGRHLRVSLGFLSPLGGDG